MPSGEQAQESRKQAAIPEMDLTQVNIPSGNVREEDLKPLRSWMVRELNNRFSDTSHGAVAMVSETERIQKSSVIRALVRENLQWSDLNDDELKVTDHIN